MDQMLGTIVLFSGNFVPRGWAYCDGSLISPQSNYALFSIIGNHYGGDGHSTFALPNLPKITDVNGNTCQYIIATMGTYPERY